MTIDTCAMNKIVNYCFSTITAITHWQGVSQKIKTANVFLKLGNWTSVYQRSPQWLATGKVLLIQPGERWKMPCLERNISEPDIIQHPQITTEKYFFLCHKLGWDMELK